MSKFDLFDKDLINDYLDRKFVVLPVCGKKPFLNRWNKLTLDDSIEFYKNSLYSKYNYAILCGSASNLFVLDIDCKNNGMKYWEKLIGIYGDPVTPTVKSGGGGLHYYFNYTDDVSKFKTSIRVISDDLGNPVGIDIRTNSGYIVAPPSIHPKTGKTYEWVEGRSLDECPLANAPSWLIEYLIRK